MKIAQIAQSYPPMISGAAGIVSQLASGLSAKGHETIVIAASDRRQGYMTRSGLLTEIRLPSQPNPARINQRFILWPYHRMKSHLRAFQPDVIHLHEPLSLGLSGIKAARQLNIPIVLTLHQLPWFAARYAPARFVFAPWVEAFLWRYGRWLLRQCQATIVASHTISDVVDAQTKIQPQIIPWGIDLSRFSAMVCADEFSRLQKKHDLDPDKPIILHVGRLDTDKQVDRVLQSAARVLNQWDAQLVIVGDGCQRDDLLSLSQKLGIQDRCRFTGYVDPQGDLPGLYQLAAVFVIASEIETFGLVVLEAMASGCPVVALNATCLPELVKDGHNGFLVAVDDEEILADKILWLLQNPCLASKMGSRGRRLSQQYDEEQMLTLHLQLYKSVRQRPQNPIQGNQVPQPNLI